MRKEVFALNTGTIDSRAVGEYLRTLRGERTVEEVSDALGLCRSAVSMYESGSRTPRDDIKIRIAAYYGKTVQDIFFNPPVTECDKLT